MSDKHGFHFGGNRLGKSEMLAVRRDALLKSGRTVAVASLVDGNAHLCVIKPFRRSKQPKPLLKWPTPGQSR